ncbi:hypothetical protein [Streptomyces sp. NBC_00344]|uniref:hypothetical protein n=1 Tax=Streptomyces sp. NBC_00344 TaxID=2975720 RepID=UPI002E23922C
MTFETAGTGTRITYRAILRFQGPLKLAGPFLRGEFERLADEVEKKLPQVLLSLG